jgi:leucine-rich repeat-containing protein 49
MIYRFHGLTQINKEEVREADRNKAKLLFLNFDKTLQIPDKNGEVEALRSYPSE